MKKLLLVFPPFSTPTSPPLGIAMLKGYLEKEAIPDWEVELFDLNLAIFHRLLVGLADQSVRLSAEIAEKIDIQMLMRAAHLFSGSNPEMFYDSGILYDHLGTVFGNFTNIFVKIFHQECADFEKTGELTPLLRLMCDLIDARQPDAVGFSMIFSDQLPVGAALGRYQREKHGRKVLMGGSCFVEGPENFLKWYPKATDAVITGDGELPLKRLLVSNFRTALAPGVTYSRNGKIKKTPPSYEKEIDQFGIPDFGGLHLTRYFSPEPVIPLLLSRGCYWRKCTFCVHYFSSGDTYRMHSLDRVIEMLRSFVEKGISNFSFVDEMIAPGHFVKLAQAIKNAKLDIAYYALSKPNKTFTPTVLKEMAESGCKYILWGVESGNQRILDLMGKGTQKEEVAQVLRSAHEAGIANHVYIICGFPTETPMEWAETLNFLNDNKEYIYATHRGNFSLEEGSPISRDLAAYQISETWVIRPTPLGARLGYRCSEGMSMEKAKSNFELSLPFLREFNPHARLLANYRDHALLFYRRIGASMRPSSRKFPDITKIIDALT